MTTELITQIPDLLPCDKGFDQLIQARNEDDLFKAYFDNIDFCLAHNYPSHGQIRKIKGYIEAGIMIDMKRIVQSPKKLVVLGRSDIEVYFNKYDVSRMYVKGESLLIIKASGNAYVVVDALDTANVHVTCTESARVVVNLYSLATCTGATKIIAKNRESYDLQNR